MLDESLILSFHMHTLTADNSYNNYHFYSMNIY